MTSPQRDASTVASRIDLPFSALISAATAGARSSARSAARSRMRSRSWAGVRRHSAAPCDGGGHRGLAVGGPGARHGADDRPSHGEVISSTAPEAAGRRSPPTSMAAIISSNQWISGSGTGSPASRKSKSQPSLAWVMCCRYSAP